MHYFKWLVILACLPFYAFPDDPNKEALEKGHKNAEIYKESGIVVDTVSAAKSNSTIIDLNTVEEAADRKKAVQRGAHALSQFSSDEDPLWKQLAQASEQIPEMTEKRDTRYGDDIDVFVMVSLSMPQRSLETLIAEVQHEYPSKNVVLMFQGYEPRNPQALISKITEISPPNVLPNLSIVIDPTYFNKLEVKEVPFFAIKTEEQGWKKVLGDVTLTEAFYEATNQYDEFFAVGKTYPIIEPNMLTLIHQKIRETDWNQQIQNATANVLKRKSQSILHAATTSYQYLVDGSTTIEKDIIHDSQIIVPAGTVVNPLEDVVFSNRYAVVDISSSNQLDIVRFWKTQHQNIKLIATVMLDPDSMEQLNNEFGQIHQLDPMLSKRFGLEYVPSLVSQNGNRLQVEVVQHDIDLASVKLGEAR